MIFFGARRKHVGISRITYRKKQDLGYYHLDSARAHLQDFVGDENAGLKHQIHSYRQRTGLLIS